MHDLDHHLSGLDRFDDLGANGAGLHLVDEAAHHFQRHVGLEQGAPHFPHGFIDVALGKRTAAGELVQNAAKALLQCLEHRQVSLSANAKRTRERNSLPDVGRFTARECQNPMCGEA